MSTATHTVMKTTALSGGPRTPPLIHNLTHSWTAGVHAICGDEGTGKTTLLRLLAGDLPALGGHVNGPAGGVFWVNLQGPEHDQSTVEACWDSLRQRYPLWNEELLQDLAEQLDMEKHRHKRLEMLSTGSRRKVTVIAALASGAAVTLLDQPFVSLDRISIRTILDFLVEAAEHPSRAWIVADYEVPSEVPLGSVLRL